MTTKSIDQLMADMQAAHAVYLQAIREKWPRPRFVEAENRFWKAWKAWKEIVEPGGHHGKAV